MPKWILLLGIALGLNAMSFDEAAQMAQTKAYRQDAGSLIQTIASTLHVTDTQAIGGSAALLSKARNALGDGEFSSLTSAIPEISTILSGASTPATESLDVTSTFEALGMQSDLVGQFVPLILDYVGANGSADLRSMLAGVL